MNKYLYSPFLDLISTRPSHIKEQRKQVPYIVTVIGTTYDRDKWRVEQAQKEIEWRVKKAKKREYVINGLLDGSLVEKHKEHIESDTTRLWRRYKENHKYDPKRYYSSMRSSNIPNKKSLFSKIYEFIINLFLDIKYN